MASDQFFVKEGPFPLSDIIKVIGCNDDLTKVSNFKIHGVQSLNNANKNDMTFLNSTKYKNISAKTKAGACITTSLFTKFLPENCIKLTVRNVLLATTQVSRMFYPKYDLDYHDKYLKEAEMFKNNYKDVSFGKNVLIGKNVKIGKNCSIGNNSIIESNVKIGENCVIGSLVNIKNSYIGNNVNIKDGAKIGTKGFGFIPNKEKNIRIPQIGRVILEDNVEIGSNCTVDRGSVSDTLIGKNTFLDNLIHIAHNVVIGKNCMFASQVGIAGSTIIGDNVVVGGQAGISGHLKIGNNVKIGGASGVIDDIPDNAKVMGYPAVSLKKFVKLREKNEK